MNRKKLDRLWKELSEARRSPQDAIDLERLARVAGRTAYKGGNHQMWRSVFPAHRPFPIARHGGKQKVGEHAQKVILDLLEADATAWEEQLTEHEQEDGEEKW